jgi:hypothetical protein
MNILFIFVIIVITKFMKIIKVLKTNKNLCLTLFMLGVISISYGQSMAITNVRITLIETEYGNARLKVVPQSYDAHAKKPTATSGVYGLLVCYKVAGKTKAIHQDLTYKFHKKGSAELFLSMNAKKSNTVINETLFYRRDLTAKSDRPTKSKCFK